MCVWFKLSYFYLVDVLCEAVTLCPWDARARNTLGNVGVQVLYMYHILWQ